MRSAASNVNKWDDRKWGKVKTFPEWHIDMSVQLQVLQCVLTGLLYTLQHNWRKANSNKLSRSKAPNTQQVERFNFKHPRRNKYYFGHQWTLKVTLLSLVPLQKFPFLCRLWFFFHSRVAKKLFEIALKLVQCLWQIVIGFYFYIVVLSAFRQV